MVLIRNRLKYHLDLMTFPFLFHFNQRLVEQIELYEVSNFNSVSTFVHFFGKLCSTIPALRNICRFIIGAIFGPYAPNNYYDVMYKTNIE